LVERSYWEAAVKGLASPVTSPPATGFATLPGHWRLVGRIAAARPSPNLLVGGDFEDLIASQSAGWSHFEYPQPGVQTGAVLTGEAVHSGKRGLRLTAKPLDRQNRPAMIESPPVWFTSPPIAVEAGQLVCIQGWVKIPAPITASVDGLMIVDSLSGEALAERIGQTGGDWRQFVLYRAVPRAGPLSITFALSGLGEASVDDVSVQVLAP
jgi:hypothetical protein